MYLPQVPAKPARARRSSPPWTKQALPSGTETVLVVEDDPFVRSYVGACSLQSLGYAVVAAVDGDDALQKLGSDAHRPAVLPTS